MSTIRLEPDQLAELAQRIAQYLDPEPAGSTGLVDAATVAQELGVARSWVYSHAPELGARRLGTGTKGRLRFDLNEARAAFATVTPAGAPASTPRPRRKHQAAPAGSILRVR